MAEYAKPWLSVDEQIDRLTGHGVEIEDRDRTASVLQAIGCYHLTGYLDPFRESEPYLDAEGRTRHRVLSDYQAGTTLRHAEDIRSRRRLGGVADRAAAGVPNLAPPDDRVDGRTPELGVARPLAAMTPPDPRRTWFVPRVGARRSLGLGPACSPRLILQRQ